MFSITLGPGPSEAMVRKRAVPRSSANKGLTCPHILVWNHLVNGQPTTYLTEVTPGAKKTTGPPLVRKLW